MKRITKGIISVVLILCLIGLWGYKTYVVKKAPTRTAENIEKGKPALVDLGSSTCIPCKEMVPVLAQVKKMYDGKVVVKFIDINEDPEETNKYEIKVIPTQIFLDKNGKEVFRHEGFFSTENIVKVFNDMGVE